MSNPIPLTTSDRRLLRAARISFGVSLFLLAVKFGAYSLTGSKAILSDALESIVNVLGALSALVVVRMVAQPADEDHPYGHGKMEYFSSAFEGGLIAFASLAIFAEAVTALVKQSPLEHVDQGIWLVAAAGGVNLALGFFLRWEGRRFKSEAIVASGRHVLADVVSTVVALVGLVLILTTGWWWLDATIALLMAGYLGLTGFRIVRRSMSGLLDEMDPQVLVELGHSLEKWREPGFIDIHNLKIIRSGRFHHVDAHIVLPYYWDVNQAHESIERYEKKVVETYSYDGEIAFHVDPCQARHCAICEFTGCAVRQKPFIRKKSFETLELTKGPDAEVSA